MALNTYLITASTTPTVIASSTIATGSTAAASLVGATLYDTVPVLVRNVGAVDAWLGSSTHTTASTRGGWPLRPNGELPLNLLGSDPLFASTTNGTCDLRVLAGRQG